LRWAPHPAGFQLTWQCTQPFVFHVRVMGDPRAVTATLVQAIHGIDQALVVYDVRTLTQQMNGTLHEERTFATLAALFGALALGLCCVGLYGVTSYSVTRRTNEVGIRMALGAARTRIMWLFLRQTLVLILVGVAIGTPIALACAQFVKSLLFGLAPADPVSFALALLVLVGVATAACLLPSHRATKVDPMVALRYE